MRVLNLDNTFTKIPEYENNETAPNFCNHFWSSADKAVIVND